MRDDLNFVDVLRRDLRDVRWPDAAEIRIRARRRSTRRAVGAAVAILVVLSAPAVAALPAGSGRSHPAGPVPSPAVRAEIPIEALLQPEDMSAKVDERFTQSGLAEPVVVEPEWTRCLEQKRVSPAWERSRYSRSQSLSRNPPTQSPHPSGLDFDTSIQLIQDVYRVDPQVTGSLFAGIDRRVDACRDWGDTQRGQIAEGEWADIFARHRWDVVGRGFAGDESVVVRHTISESRRDDADGEVLAFPPEPQSTAVVRVGDLVTVLKLGSLGGELELRRLAVLAAERMCAAANPAC
ncbi:hypothetical protein ACSNN7_10220 [Micromonospora sp. URMC 105]|uniref:hypothetical protein n=1 Tax=Micromonospora sp. URMC 105 TaxID=3423413 RepID=UPI003F1D072A